MGDDVKEDKFCSVPTPYRLYMFKQSEGGM